MEKFRIGNDLSIFWAILDDDGQPYPLSDKKVRLFVTHPRGRMEVTDDMSIENGHVVVWNFQASKQRYLGTYKLTVEIYSSPTTRVLRRDIEEAFSLVSASLYEDVESGKPDINDTGMLRLSSVLEVIRVSPVIPQIGENGNWVVEGEDTGQPARGEKGAVADIAYVYFDIDGDMELSCSVVAGDSSIEEGFGISEDGYLTLDSSVDGVTGNLPSSSASFKNLIEVTEWEYDDNGKKYFPEDKFEQVKADGLCSVLYKGVIYHAVLAENRMVIFSSYYIPDADLRYKNVYQFAVNFDTREVMENSQTLLPLEESPLTDNLNENTSFLLATKEGVRTVPVMGLLGELVNIILDLQNRVSELEQKIN